MVSYGLNDEDDSFDTMSSYPQSRKRTYPAAFPVEEPPELYPYDAVPVAIEESHEWHLPLGLTAGVLMNCFLTALAWTKDAVLVCGRKFFQAGTASNLLM
jgi:hypothetical protein